MTVPNTFQVKVIATDGDLKVQYEDAVQFDTDLPEFK